MEDKRPKRKKPHKLTPQLQAEICKSLKQGAFIEAAAAEAGVSKQSLYLWLKKGEEDKDGPYREFLEECQKSLILGEKYHADQIKILAKLDWKAHAYLLERLNPRRWGKREIVKLEDNETKDGAFDANDLNAAIARELDKVDDGERWE